MITPQGRHPPGDVWSAQRARPDRAPVGRGGTATTLFLLEIPENPYRESGRILDQRVVPEVFINYDFEILPVRRARPDRAPLSRT